MRDFNSPDCQSQNAFGLIRIANTRYQLPISQPFNYQISNYPITKSGYQPALRKDPTPWDFSTTSSAKLPAAEHPAVFRHSRPRCWTCSRTIPEVSAALQAASRARDWATSFHPGSAADKTF